MLKSLLAAGTILVALAGPALAGECPALSADPEETLVMASLDDATNAKIRELTDTGKADYAAGIHPDSQGTLSEALKVLGK